MEERMNEDQLEMTYEESVEFLRNYIGASEKSQAAVAQELGVSASALSSFLAGKYKTPHTLIPKIRELKTTKEKRADMLSAPPYVETSITRKVLSAIRYSHLRGALSVAYGDAGVGKTQAYKHYLQDNALAIGITASPTYASITGVNELLAEQLNVREHVSRRITREIVYRLKGSGRVILVDEAQHLTTRTLDHLRCIADEAGIGICLIGNEQVYTRLRGSGKADFAQLYSRIGMRMEVLNKQIGREDVAAVFFDGRLKEGALGLLYRVCQTGHSLRGAVNVYINTAAAFGPDGVSAGTLAKMMREMNIGR